MAYKKVSLILTVPEGKYCWNYMNNGSPCFHFDNYTGAKCEVFRQPVNKDDGIGYEKLPQCQELKEV